MKKNTLFLFGNTHFDPVWLWTWDEAMASIRATFRSALDRMNEDEDYIYSFCTPPVFQWIETVDPAMFEEIKERVKEGRWDLAEGMWVQPDCNAPHGESLVRHGLYTQRYLSQTFGRTATTVFNIDSFGHCASIPQIMSKCGIELYVFGRPNNTDYELPGPLFNWESPDGSRLMTLRCGHYEGKGMYAPMGGLDIRQDIAWHDEIMAKLSHDYAIVYGVSNHGGAPTKECLRLIREELNEGSRQVRYGSTTDFLNANREASLPVVADELQVRFFGPYSNDTTVKVNNRIAEYAAMRAEKAAIFAGPVSYPKEKLEQSWRDILFNQFHDILGGASIRYAYHDARNLHGRALQTLNDITHTSLQSVTKSICMPGNELEDADWNVVLWNLNSHELTQTFEAEVQWMWEHEPYDGDLELVDENGTVYPCQIIRELSVILSFRSRFAFHATIPAHGYKSFAVVKKHIPVQSAELPSNGHIENERYKLTVNDNGAVVVYDKRVDKVTVRDAFAMTVLEDAGDTWAFNVATYGDSLGPIVITDARIIEDGDIMTVLKVTAKYGDSILEQYWTIYTNSDEIDYRYRVNWNEKHAALKLCFALPEGCSNLTAANPYGHIKRPIDGLEYPVGEWLHVANDNKGFSLLLKSAFAYDTVDDELRITLLRSPVYGDLRMHKPLDPLVDYDYLNQGITEGTIRLYPNSTDFISDSIPSLASAYNNPPIIIAEANHDGQLPGQGQYIGIDANTVMLSVIKKSEDGDDIILRLVEYGGTNDIVNLTWQDVKLEAVRMSAYEIKTLRLDMTNFELTESDMLENSLK